MFGGPYDKQALVKFWQTVAERGDPRLAHHPMVRLPDWASRAIPIAIHGDAVPCTGVGKSSSKSWDCWTWQSLLTKGKSELIKNYMFGLFEDSKKSPTAIDGSWTMRDIWRHVCWSLLACYKGG
eukprot:4455910-Alexandrium_andersonii.AAC.1